MGISGWLNKLGVTFGSASQMTVDKRLNPAEIMMNRWDPDSAYAEDSGSKRISPERAGYRAMLGARLGT